MPEDQGQGTQRLSLAQEQHQLTQESECSRSRLLRRERLTHGRVGAKNPIRVV